MPKKVLITGAAGTIGTILREDLASKYDLTLVDVRPCHEVGFRRVDVAADYHRLRRIVAGHDTLVHLAYLPENETGCANELMTKNVFRAALEAVPHPRVILASSIHVVGGHVDWQEEPYRRIARMPCLPPAKPPRVITTAHRLLPNSVYGATKAYAELLGAVYAKRGLEVVVIRFGGVRCDNHMPDEVGYHAFWLSRRDCAKVVSRAIDADLADNFSVLFAVSNNRFRIHDLSSAKELIGFEPEDDSARLMEG